MLDQAECRANASYAAGLTTCRGCPVVANDNLGNRLRALILPKSLKIMVGAVGFEPTTR